MYQISGGGYGGNAGGDGISNGCSTIGISKSPPVEIMEQAFPVLYRHYALREGSGGAGKHRGGFGLSYEVELLRGEARASFVMDHGRFGPQGALGGRRRRQPVTVFRDGVANTCRRICPRSRTSRCKAGDRVQVEHARRRRLWRSAQTATRRWSGAMSKWDIIRRRKRGRSLAGREDKIDSAEIQIRTSRKWWLSRTGAQCTFECMSTGSAESRHLQAGLI
jgi:hypothetical protein